MLRYAAKVDANHGAIVKTFRSLGCTVYDCSRLKKFCDIVVGFAGRSYLIEIKDGTKPPSAQKLTKDEEEFHATWRGGIYIIRSETEAIQFVSSRRSSKDAV